MNHDTLVSRVERKQRKRGSGCTWCHKVKKYRALLAKSYGKVAKELDISKVFRQQRFTLWMTVVSLSTRQRQKIEQMSKMSARDLLGSDGSSMGEGGYIGMTESDDECGKSRLKKKKIDVIDQRINRVSKLLQSKTEMAQSGDATARRLSYPLDAIDEQYGPQANQFQRVRSLPSERSHQLVNYYQRNPDSFHSLMTQPGMNNSAIRLANHQSTTRSRHP